MSNYQSVCEEAARAGGAVLQDWVGRFAIRSKGPADLVTEADEAAQRAIHDIIRRHFPEHDFVGEEDTGAQRSSSEYRWIVDPLDGTSNYANGVPHYSVSVALEHQNSLLAGVVFDPVLDECFSAMRGEGATLNGTAISTNASEQLAEVLVATGFPPRVNPDLLSLRQLPAVMQNCLAIRRGGSAALNLAYVACGRFGAYWAAELYPWDAAAGALLVQEAGGKITNLEGQAFDVWQPRLIATCSTAVHTQLSRVLEGVGT